MDASLPGVKTVRTAAMREIFITRQGAIFLPSTKIIEGSKARDSGNTGDLDVLRAGLLLGIDTTGGKYRPSIIGVLTGAEVVTATSVTVSAAQAVELVRRVGATGTIRLVGPPTAAGTVATFTETYSAVNVTTGVITCSALDAALIAGSFVCADDGSYLPVSLITALYGIKVTDKDNLNIDTAFAQLLVGGGVLDSSQILLWPSDTSLIQWIKDKLRVKCPSFIFDDDF